MYIYIFHLSLTLVPCFQNTSNICPVQSIQNTQFYCCTYGMRSMCGVLISLRGTGVQLWILYFCIIIFSCQFRISFFIHDFFFCPFKLLFSVWEPGSSIGTALTTNYQSSYPCRAEVRSPVRADICLGPPVYPDLIGSWSLLDCEVK